MSLETTLEEKKDILLITLLYDFCNNNKCQKSFEYFCFKLYQSGYISKNTFTVNPDNFENNLISISTLYNTKIEENSKSILKNPNKFLESLLSNISSFSRFKSQFTTINHLGSGGFGDVYKVKNTIDENDYAIKILNMEHLIHESYLILREVRILSKLKHNNIIGYYSSWIGVDEIDNYQENNSFLKLYIQMELCDSNLSQYIDDRTEINKEGNYIFINQICDGLEYIHNKNIIHRDIKPKNIFIKNNQELKIGDFGLSRKKIEGTMQTLISSKDLKYTSDIGSLLYSAPELLDSNNYDETVDIYSFGILIYELFNNFKTEMEKTIEINKFKKNKVNEIEMTIFDISLKCIGDPKNRPNIKLLKKLLS